MKLFKFFNEKTDKLNDTSNEPDIDRNGVMIVDDSRFSRNVLRDILENEGFEVVGEAGDGKEAVEKAKELSPELIFLDVEMPILDGLGALPQIMKHDPGINVIMCTALGQKKIIMEATKAGAKDYVIKPYRKENIIDVLVPYKEVKARAAAEALQEPEELEEPALEDVQDNDVIADDVSLDEMQPLGYIDEEDTSEGLALDSEFESDEDSLLRGIEGQKTSDIEERALSSSEFTLNTSEDDSEENYGGLFELDGFDETPTIDETLGIDTEDEAQLDTEEYFEVEEEGFVEDELKEVEEVFVEDELDEVEEVFVEDELDEVEEVFVEDELDEVEEEFVEDKLEEEKVFVKDKLEEEKVFVKDELVEDELEQIEEEVVEDGPKEILEDVAVVEDIEVDDSIDYSFIYMNRFASHHASTTSKTSSNVKRTAIDFERIAANSVSDLLAQKGIQRIVMLGMMSAYIEQVDEWDNIEKVTLSIELSINSNENRRFVKDVYGHDIHTEEISMLNVISKVDFTNLSSIKLHDKSNTGLHSAISDIVTNKYQRQLHVDNKTKHTI